ncbi:MAG: alpha/beta hydrolase [SAR324 cluster bacterium]|nr:alpha/beta hydrolase [SAR324 cluster bacterium]
MPHLNVDGIRVHYREDGQGPPVIFTHGGGSSGAQWRKVCELLAPRWRTITVDHYGHGGTGPWPGAIEARTHEDDARLVRAVMDHAGEPAHLVGHSFGGGVVLRLVLEEPAGVRSLTLLEPIALSLLAEAGETALHEDYMAFANEFLRRVRMGRVETAWEDFMEVNNGPGSWQRLSTEAREKMLGITLGVCSGWHANFNHATTLAECGGIALPTLVMYGDGTHPRFIRLAEILSEHIPGATLETIPGAGHMSPLSHPEALAELLAAHLEKH